MATTYRTLEGSERKEYCGEPTGASSSQAIANVVVVLSKDSTIRHAISLAAAARAFGLVCVGDPQPHRVKLFGTVSQLQKAFNVELHDHVDADGVPCRCRSGAVCIPDSFGSNIVAVLGLDTRPQSRAHHHFRPRADPRVFTGHQSNEIASAYGIVDARGKSHSIGIIELGGTYQPKAMKWYFNKLGIARKPNVVVNGVTRPSQKGATVEVMLDAEIIASLVPAARTVIYFGANTTAGFYNAIADAIDAGHDAISISWGAPEQNWTPSAMRAYDALAEYAGTKGVTITAAAGDAGSSDGVTGVEVDFPASAPHILACGGTSLTMNAGEYGSEVVWNNGPDSATGGGYSELFTRPSYQDSVNIGQNTMRMVPDVAGVADPETGYMIRVNGETINVGGTSAVSPLWAAIICKMNMLLDMRLGFCHETMYSLAGQLRQITSGNNGAYQAGSPYNLCTGLGSAPANLLEMLSQVAQV